MSCARARHKHARIPLPLVGRDWGWGEPRPRMFWDAPHPVPPPQGERERCGVRVAPKSALASRWERGLWGEACASVHVPLVAAGRLQLGDEVLRAGPAHLPALGGDL